MSKHMLPDSAQVHIDGLGLADRMRIYADKRDPNAGNASHEYEVWMEITPGPGEALWPKPAAFPTPEEGTLPAFDRVARIIFQHGPRDEDGSTPGILDTVLVAILLDRYRGFQSGSFVCRENALVITKLEEALHWMENRARTRRRQGVLGYNKEHAPPA